MIPKVLMMQTGERVIAATGELTDDEGKGICLVIRCPYILDMTPSGDISPDGSPTQFSVNFTKWFAYSITEQFRIPYSSVIAIGDPEPGITEVYLERFGDKLNDDNTVQPSDSSDSSEESGLSDSGDRGEGGEP